MDRRSVSMLSCNVRGLWDKLKRKTMFNKMLSSLYILFSQETHSTPDIENTWGKDWPGQIICNHGENNARGTIIAFNSKSNPIIHDSIVDDQGRSIILDCTILKHCFTLVNIYAPNADDLASPFFGSTFKELGKLPKKTKIIAGDFNVVINKDNDKLGGNSELHKMPRNIILNKIENQVNLHFMSSTPTQKNVYIFQAKTQKCFVMTRLFLNF